MLDERDDREGGQGRRDALKKLGAGAAGATGLWAAPGILSVPAVSAATAPPAPPGSGPYTYQILNIADDPFISTLNPSPGDIANHDWVWPAISDPNVPGLLPSDTTFFSVPLASPFRFYGQTFGAGSQIMVSPKGAIGFGGVGPNSFNLCLPLGAAPNRMYVYWDSLDFGWGLYSIPLIGGYVTPSFLVISWYQFFLTGSPADRGTMEFAVVLHFDTMQIDFVYYNVSTDVAGPSARDNGATATVGIQGLTASQYTQVGCNPYQVAFPGPEVIGTPIPGVEAGTFIRFTG